MRKFFIIYVFCFLPFFSFCQQDTALVNFKKLFRWKPLTVDVSYGNKEFLLDSIWNSAENNGYIKYRSEVLQKPANIRIPNYLSKRFIKLDTLSKNEEGDTLRAEFYALGYVGAIKNIFCYLIERQFASKYYRSSEKYLFTFDKRCKPIDKLLLTHEIPGTANPDNFDVLTGNFNEMTWFEETKGFIYEDMTIQLENEIGKIFNYKIKETGKIVKK